LEDASGPNLDSLEKESSNFDIAYPLRSVPVPTSSLGFGLAIFFLAVASLGFF
jgi:hypothetical protein